MKAVSKQDIFPNYFLEGENNQTLMTTPILPLDVNPLNLFLV